jgi:hypothetical protein
MSDNEKTSVIDQMIEDVEATEAPQEYPVGAPEFKVLLALRPRGRRAEFKRLLADIAEKSGQARDGQVTLKRVKDERRKERELFLLSAYIDEALELIDKALRLVAVDEAKYDAWSAEASDEDLQTTWAVYQNRTQPGEASSSTS